MEEKNAKINITIRIGDNKPIPMVINQADEPDYRAAEKLVEALWLQRMKRFKDTATNQEVMTRVAFECALLYAQAYRVNDEANQAMAQFEARLNDFVLKL